MQLWSVKVPDNEILQNRRLPSRSCVHVVGVGMQKYAIKLLDQSALSVPLVRRADR